MRTAITGLLALATVSAAIFSVATAPTFAQVEEPGTTFEITTTEAYETPEPIEAFQLTKGTEPIEASEPIEAFQLTKGMEPLEAAAAGEAAAPIEAAEPELVELGTFTTTAYSLRGPMRSGEYVYYGAVAVDPRVIPLGSTLYIEDLGYFVAEDTGGAIRGNRIDIWFTTYREAVTYGVQHRRAWLVP